MNTLSTAGSPQVIPAFLTKLKLLVDDEETNDLIYWDPLGTSFHICDGNRLAKELLPLYFKHNNLSSFIRQLNMYGFRKVNRLDPSFTLKTDAEDMEFSHPYFIRNKDYLLARIQRKTSNNFCTNTMGGTNYTYNVTVPKLLHTNTQSLKGSFGNLSQRAITSTDFLKLAETVRNMRNNQEALNQQLGLLKSENQLMYRELSDLREHHERQSQLIQTLFSFLTAFAKESRPGSLCIGSTKRRALPSIGPSEISFGNRGLKLNLPHSFQFNRTPSNQSFPLIPAENLGTPRKLPKLNVRTLASGSFDVNSLSNKELVATDGESNNCLSTLQDIQLPSSIILSSGRTNSDLRYIQDMVDNNGVISIPTSTDIAKVQDDPTLYFVPDIKPSDDNFLNNNGNVDEFAPIPDSVDGFIDNGEVDTSVLGLDWSPNRSPFSFITSDSQCLGDLLTEKNDSEPDDALQDIFLSCEPPSGAEEIVALESPTEQNLNYLDLTDFDDPNNKKQNQTKVIDTPVSDSNNLSCETRVYKANNSQLVPVTSSGGRYYLNSESNAKSTFDSTVSEISLQPKTNEPDQESINTSKRRIVGSEIILAETANPFSRGKVMQLLGSQPAANNVVKENTTFKPKPNVIKITNKQNSTQVSSTLNTPVIESSQNDTVDESSFIPSTPSSWMSSILDNRSKVGASPKIKRKQKAPALLRFYPSATRPSQPLSDDQ